MPYIELQARDVKGAHAAASEVATTVAAALELAPGDVIVSVVAAAGVYDANGPVNGWPSAILHGRPRQPDAMSGALLAVRETLGRHLGISANEVWAHWCT